VLEASDYLRQSSFDLPAVRRKKVTAAFDGGLISSDGPGVRSTVIVIVVIVR